ncbi:hypothetical protein [Agrobacterium burrii]
MNKAIHLSERQYTEIVGKKVAPDRPLLFGVLAEVVEPTAAAAQPETIEIRSEWRMWHAVEGSEPDVSRDNRRSSEILRRTPYFLFLQDICAFVAISAFITAICILSQEIASKTI